MPLEFERTVRVEPVAGGSQAKFDGRDVGALGILNLSAEERGVLLGEDGDGGEQEEESEVHELASMTAWRLGKDSLSPSGRSRDQCAAWVMTR